MSQPYSYSYSGRKVGPGYEAPPLRDVAVALGRLCRYAGNCARFWTVLQHSLVVADLLPDGLKIYGLLHDAEEAVTNDVPMGFKNDEFRRVGDAIRRQILESLELSGPSPDEQELIKRADEEALLGEIWVVGVVHLRNVYRRPSRRAEELVLRYAREFPPAECIAPDGLAVVEFVRRFKEYQELREEHRGQKT